MLSFVEAAQKGTEGWLLTSPCARAGNGNLGLKKGLGPKSTALTTARKRWWTEEKQVAEYYTDPCSASFPTNKMFAASSRYPLE